MCRTPLHRTASPCWAATRPAISPCIANQQGIAVHAAYYYGDQYLRPTLGLHLIAGRDFDANEIRHGRARADSPVIIVSKPVADALFPNGDALGQTVYQDGNPATIVGIVERLQTPTRSEKHLGLQLGAGAVSRG